ncbi:MAG: hypothetical protein U5M23_15875 [Marinagarivorans sp.]|nr:hypothetical protein [Marinagarivorans sp.]
MNILWVIGLVWLLFGLWRGYKQGAIKVFASLLAVLAGYVGCFVWGWPLAQKLTGVVAPVWQWPLATLIIFIAAAVVCKLLAWPFARWYQEATSVRLLGAALNGGISMMMLLAAIWSLGLLAGTTQSPRLTSALARVGYSAVHPLVVASHGLVAHGVYWGLKMVGADDKQAFTAAKLSHAPAQSVAQLQQVAQSPSTRELINSASFNDLLASGNSRALRQNAEFQAFAQQPGMQDVMALLPKLAGQAPEAALADTLLTVWQKVAEVKHSPEVQAALADPEVQALMKKGDNMALIRHPKMQPMLNAIMSTMSKNTGARFTDNQTDSQTDYSTEAMNAVQNVLPFEGAIGVNNIGVNNSGDKQDVMYKWFDDKGKTHYSTWDKIPKNNREGAELMNL